MWKWRRLFIDVMNFKLWINSLPSVEYLLNGSCLPMTLFSEWDATARVQPPLNQWGRKVYVKCSSGVTSSSSRGERLQISQTPAKISLLSPLASRRKKTQTQNKTNKQTGCWDLHSKVNSFPVVFSLQCPGQGAPPGLASGSCSLWEYALLHRQSYPIASQVGGCIHRSLCYLGSGAESPWVGRMRSSVGLAHGFSHPPYLGCKCSSTCGLC